MNSQLLAVVSSERERRNAPAVRALQSISKDGSYSVERHAKFWRRLRNHVREVFRTARLAVALRGYTGKPIVLPGSGHKMDEVREELREAGIPRTDIESIYFRTYRNWAASDFMLFIYWLFFAAAYRVAIAKRLSERTLGYTNVIFQYACLCSLLRRISKRPYWCVIGDLSPFLIALAGAARKEEHGLISWQYGYQDFKHFPAQPDLAVVLNRTGIELARIDSQESTVPVFQRKTIRPEPVRFRETLTGTVGVVLNAFSRPEVLSEIKNLQEHLQCRLLVRPHPRDQQMQSVEQMENVQVAPPETLTEFCESVDWIVCGNTTSALKIRGLGFPVCQYFGFDHFFQDHFGYAEMEIIPAFQRISDISRQSIVSFYEGDRGSHQLGCLFGQVDMEEIQPLSRLAAVIARQAENMRTCEYVRP